MIAEASMFSLSGIYNLNPFSPLRKMDCSQICHQQIAGLFKVLFGVVLWLPLGVNPRMVVLRADVIASYLKGTSFKTNGVFNNREQCRDTDHQTRNR